MFRESTNKTIFNSFLDIIVKNFLKNDNTSLSDNISLYRAASEGRKDVIENIIKSGANIDLKNNEGITAFYIAVSNGYLDIATSLLEAGADINIRNSQGYTLLCKAIIHDRMDVVEYLINKNANLNILDSGRLSSLHHAIIKENKNLVSLLLSTGLVLLNIEDVQGFTPLHYAVQKGLYDISNLLISRGAEVNKKDQFNNTPIIYAVRKGFKQLVQLLINMGADVNIANNDLLTPLHYAARNGHLEIVEFLVKNGSYLNVQDQDKLSPLHMAIQGGHKEIVSFLINLKDIDLEIKDKDDDTPLHYALQKQYKEIVWLLINKEANVNIKGKNGTTPLHLSVMHGYEDIVQWAINQNIYLDLRDNQGYTPLHIAVLNNHVKIVTSLTASGISINIRDNDGNTGIQLALEKGYIEIVKHLLNFRDIDLRGIGKEECRLGAINTLKELIKYNELTLIRALVNSMTNVNTNDNEGKSLLECTFMYGNFDATKILLEKKGIEVNCIMKPIYKKNVRKILEWLVTDKAGNIKNSKRKRILELFLNAGFDINDKNELGETLLHIAVQKECVEGVDLVTYYNASQDVVAANLTPLDIAIKTGNTTLVKLLLDRRKNPLDFLSKIILLDTALMEERFEIAKILLQEIEGFDFTLLKKEHYKSEYIIELLNWAIKHGKKNLVQEFIESGIDLFAKDMNNKMALEAVLESNDVSRIEIAELLLKKYDKLIEDKLKNNNNLSSDIDLSFINKREYISQTRDLLIISIKKKYNFLYSFLKVVNNINYIDNDGEALIHKAVRYNNVNAIEFLCLKGSDVNILSKHQLSPLHLAVIGNHKETIEVLLKYKANVNIKGQRNNTPLHLACSSGYLDIAKIFIKIIGVEFDAVNIDGDTPLSLTVKKDKLDIAMELLNLYPGASLDFVGKEEHDDYYGYKTNIIKFYHKLCEFGKEEILRRFIAMGVEIDAKDTLEQTSLHVAVEKSRVNIVKILLENGSNINERNKLGDTVLHIAIDNGDREIIDILLDNENKADIEVIGQEGIKALELSIKQNKLDIAKKILAKRIEVDVSHIVQDRYYNILQELVHWIISGRNTSINSAGKTFLVKSFIKAGIPIKECYIEKAIENKMQGIAEALFEEYNKLLDKNPNHEIKLGFVPSYQNDENLHRLLQYGIEKSCFHAIKVFLESEFPVNAFYHNSTTLLHKAANENQRDIIFLLLKKGANPSFVDNNNLTAVDIALNKNYFEIVIMMLNKISVKDITAIIRKHKKNIKEELLSFAVMKREIKIIEVMVEIEKVPKELIEKALQANDIEITAILLKSNGIKNISEFLNRYNDKIIPLICEAIKRKDKEVVEKLLNIATIIDPAIIQGILDTSKVIKEVVLQNYQEYLQKLANNKICASLNLNFLHNEDNKEKSASLLHVAVDKGYVDVVQMLVDSKVDVNYVIDNNKVIAIAIKKVFNKRPIKNNENDLDQKYKKIIEILVKAGVNIDVQVQNIDLLQYVENKDASGIILKILTKGHDRAIVSLAFQGEVGSKIETKSNKENTIVDNASDPKFFEVSCNSKTFNTFSTSRISAQNYSNFMYSDNNTHRMNEDIRNNESFQKTVSRS